ncbi:MAG: hypothetical protein EKK65_08030 [Lysobacterales bacterium]|nr:MAG: hypothetical protein EKK65_08030 [Xanthomonadales bacterium]
MSRFPRRVSARFVVLLSAGLLPLSALHAQAGAGTGDLPPDPLDARIEEARNAYGAGDYDTSIAALETVLAELRLRKSNAYERWLPAPPKGWQASRPEAGAAPQPAAGGIRAERRYTHGDEQLQLTITGESALLQGLGAVFDNPAALGSGPRIERLDGRRALYDPAGNALRVLVGNDAILVEARGNAAVSEATLQAFLRRVDFDTIEKSLR